MSFQSQTIVIGLVLCGSIIAFGAYFLHVTHEAEHSSFMHMKINKDGEAQEHVLRIKWPITQIGPLEMKVRQQPVDATQIESLRQFMSYYANNYARYLKQKVASPAMNTSSPSVKLILQPAQHYYFDEDTLGLFDSGKSDEPKLDESVDGNHLIEKQDSLYLVLLTGISFCSTIVNAFLGSKVLASSLPFLVCLFLIPFYRGYLKGALRGDFINRLKGWENLVLILFMFPTIVFSLQYLLPQLFTSLTQITRGSLNPVSLSYPTLLAFLFAGLAFFVYLLAVVEIGSFMVRAAAVRLAKSYFDNSPSKRADVLRAIMYAGSVRSIQVNAILSAMLHRADIELRLGDKTLRVQDSMVDSEGLIRGSYCKGWNWFLDIYVLCLALASTFTLVIHIFR